MKVITREQMKQLETVTINRYHVPSLILMENAGRMTAQTCVKYLKELKKDPRQDKVVVVCGTGNNGGDGAVVARHLSNMGVPVQVVLTRDLHGIFTDRTKDDDDEDSPISDKALGDVGLNFKILKAFEVPVRLVKEGDVYPLFFQGAALIVDALMGTGLDTMTGQIKSPMKELIQTMNDLEIPVLSIDVPSGLDSNTGALAGIGVRADRTVTFGLPKRGFYESMGPSHCGDISIVDISIPRKLMRQVKDAREGDEIR